MSLWFGPPLWPCLTQSCTPLVIFLILLFRLLPFYSLCPPFFPLYTPVKLFISPPPSMWPTYFIIFLHQSYMTRFPPFGWSGSLISSYPMSFSLRCNHPSLFFLSLNLQWCSHLWFNLFYNFTLLLWSNPVYLLPHLLASNPLVFSTRLYLISQPLFLFSHSTTSLLATPITMYHDWASKVTLPPLSSTPISSAISFLGTTAPPSSSYRLFSFSLPTSPFVSYISFPLPLAHHPSQSSFPPRHCFLPYEIVNHLSSCFCYTGSDKNRQANSLKYTWKTQTHSQTHASLICWFASTRCIIHFFTHI